MPSHIGLNHFEQRRLVGRACKIIREAYLRDKKDIILDFSKTVKIFSNGMLLIVAELDRAMRMVGSGQIVRCKLPEGDGHEAKIVREVLDQIGLLERIGQRPANCDGDQEHDQSVRHWRYATGTRVDEEPGDVLEEHEGRITHSLMESMQIGVTEALLNSLHHAYLRPREDGCKPFKEKRWWMFTHERDGMLHVAVCDLGIGIPRSLPLKWSKDLLKRLLSIFDTGSPHLAAIRMALILGKSSTGEKHRGNGLPQIWNASRASSAGQVGIHSGRAFLGFDSAKQVETASEFKTDLLGTLVTWTFPIEVAGGLDG